MATPPFSALSSNNPAISCIVPIVNYNVLTTFFPPKAEGSIDAEWVAKIKTVLPDISVLQAPKTLLNPEQQYLLITRQMDEEFSQPRILEQQKGLMSGWNVSIIGGETPANKELVRNLFIGALRQKYNLQRNYDEVMRLAEQAHLHPNLRVDTIRCDELFQTLPGAGVSFCGGSTSPAPVSRSGVSRSRAADYTDDESSSSSSSSSSDDDFAHTNKAARSCPKDVARQ